MWSRCLNFRWNGSRMIINFRKNTRQRIQSTCGLVSFSQILISRMNFRRFYHVLTEAQEDHSRDSSKSVTRNKQKSNRNLIMILEECSSSDEQIKKFCQFQSITESELKERVDFMKYLEKTFEPFFPECEFTLVGSSVSGFGLTGCDIDVSFQTGQDLSSREAIYGLSDLPCVKELRNGSVPASKLLCFAPNVQLKFVQHVLTECCKPPCQHPINFIKGRCPILKFRMGKDNLSCDISINNRQAVETTRLLQLCGRFDDRVIPLAKVINYWAKLNHLIGPFKFKSYAFLLLVFHFLQTRAPPILPALQDFLKFESFYAESEQIFEDIKSLPKSSNQQSLSDLLREFFFFYLDFDFQSAICPFAAGTVSKTVFMPDPNADETEKLILTSICIQDPLCLTWNVMSGLNFKFSKEFMKALLISCKEYQEKEVWNFKAGRNNGEGLSRLLLAQDWHPIAEERSFTVDLPVEGSSAQTIWQRVLQILDVGLLFDVKTDASEDSLTARCTTCSSWQWRYKCPKRPFQSLKEERIISEHVLNEHESRSARVELCLEGRYDADTNLLRIQFSMQKKIFPPAFVVFFKEYLPMAMYMIKN